MAWRGLLEAQGVTIGGSTSAAVGRQGWRGVEGPLSVSGHAAAAVTTRQGFDSFMMTLGVSGHRAGVTPTPAVGGFVGSIATVRKRRKDKRKEEVEAMAMMMLLQ